MALDLPDIHMIGTFTMSLPSTISCQHFQDTQKFPLSFNLPDLHALGPVAHVLAQEEVVEGAGTHEVVELSEDLLHQLRIHSVLRHDPHVAVQLLYTWPTFSSQHI